MSEMWTADVVGQMHLHKITGIELAQELGVTNRYVSMLLNGHRTPKGAEQKCRTAIESILKKRERDNSR